VTDVPPFEPPTITDDDIPRICSLLGLGEDAFCGPDPRNGVLKCKETIDVAACPGSGKTTLLVAKLAILAEKWPYRTRGICVLSHTNAARTQIEERLGNTTAGRRLLSYPHHVGTIHGFVDRFLALPWLRSNGYSIKLIDTDLCKDRRWWKLDPKVRNGYWSHDDTRSKVRIESLDFDVYVPWGKGALKPGNDKYEAYRDACRLCAEEGYFCYEDMFVFAHDLLDREPSVAGAIRDRFPLLFIDEVQDNSEEQAAILKRIFMDGGSSVIRQRFGDPNQAIFGSIGAKEATTDVFPSGGIKNLPNSHRFGQEIADLADPLGLTPYKMKGEGPKQPLDSRVSHGDHTIFLFGDGDANKVLPAYAELLMETFSERELREGVFVAVGHRHKPPDKEDAGKCPYHVGDYWPDYDPQLASSDPKPRSLAQYVSAGMGRAQATREAHHCVEKIAEGILRLAGNTHQHRHKHRYVRELLEDDDAAGKRYENLLAAFALRREAPTAETWNGEWSPAMREIAEVIAECAPSGEEAEGFLKWADAPANAEPEPHADKPRDNLYRHVKDGQEVLRIRVGSIHSAKGETHTATLVLETVWKKHNLEKLKRWLTREEEGGGSEGPEQLSRLKAHYVAMTRPTHLLCLAMKRSAIDDEAVGELEQRGWRVKYL
jgi:superfamily I DNA/RNA helicase